jgi:pimeloyl-ACP methyl ester carboxylesterase
LREEKMQTPIEHEVTFQSGSLTLAGTLLLPSAEGHFPVVLLLPGSGEVDRDENVKKLPINALREIADYLAGQGIATFRYDKRGVGASGGVHMGTGFSDHVDDAAAALTWLQAQEQIQAEKIFALGHSEGSGLALRLAATGAHVAGIILLAGWARPSEDMLIWQAEQVVPTMGGINPWLIKVLHLNLRKMQLKQFAKIKQSKKDWYRQLHVKINAKWLREFLNYTPGDDLAKIHVPVLAITGSKDIQVDPADISLMAKLVKGEFEGHVLPDVTHLLRADSGQPTIKNYAEQVKRPVDARLLNLISDWLHRHTELAYSLEANH